MATWIFNEKITEGDAKIDDLLSQAMRYPDNIVAPTKKTLKSMLFELTQMLRDLEKNSQQLPDQLISSMIIMCIGNAGFADDCIAAARSAMKEETIDSKIKTNTMTLDEFDAVARKLDKLYKTQGDAWKPSHSTKFLEGRRRQMINAIVAQQRSMKCWGCDRTGHIFKACTLYVKGKNADLTVRPSSRLSTPAGFDD